jgi:acetone carboxylase alpha subunit
MDPISVKAKKQRKTIGWDGKTLKEMRQEIDEISRTTGHYAGLKTLPLKESDPIRYEKIFAKLRGGVVHARETAKRVAASPIVEQEGELCFT